ncbi:hypothetical protein [Candidatus Nitrosotalea okcheonensis]|uniref:Uncharacterized protein n=1 Tax=Candidatus Nitrosotalea okcheonensis TaxID=1903276 RepID=A0A2H1FFC3_9ARCH|nr:hypothetical protein [Candidatus Nitrosotalea okcheonensis]SMH71463.1 protein of unknown function [Candidatus Nitrosotalea okcheonensis]
MNSITIIMDFEYIIKLEDRYMLFIRFILIKKSKIVNIEAS